MYNHHICGMSEKILPAIAAAITNNSNIREALEQSLTAYWNDYAVHVWHIQDVFFDANRTGKPMSTAVAREILANIEDNIDCEHGLTWDTLHTSISDWFDSVNWQSFSNAELYQYSGFFILRWETPEGSLLHYAAVLGNEGDVRDANLLTAVEMARQISQDQAIPVFIHSTGEYDPTDEDNLKQSALTWDVLLKVESEVCNGCQ
jgi:hypothetical protein